MRNGRKNFPLKTGRQRQDFGTHVPLRSLPAGFLILFYQTFLFRKLHHSHSAVCACRHSRSRLFDGGNYGLGGQQGCGNAGSVLQCASGNLNRIKDTSLDHVYILFVVCIKSSTYFGLFYFVDHNSAFQTCVCYDVEQRSLECFLYDSCTDLLVAVQAVNQLCKLCCYMNVCRTAACDDTLFYGCSRCI